MAESPFTLEQVRQALAGQYEVHQELRAGGQGAVYKGRSLVQDHSFLVAIKLHTNPSQEERVNREAKALSKLRHPALSTYVEDGFCHINDRETHFIVWEYIDGQPLDKLIAVSRLSESQVCRLAADVCAAISAIWSKRIVHRDINPRNIMVKAAGAAVLIDLGGARHLDESSITAPGYTFGTMGYFSPEQFRAERALTAASDVYSLGVVLLEGLLGTHPTKHDQMRLIRNEFVIAPEVLQVRPRIAHTIAQMLAPRAAFRPSVLELESLFRQHAIEEAAN